MTEPSEAAVLSERRHSRSKTVMNGINSNLAHGSRPEPRLKGRPCLARNVDRHT